MRSIRSLSLALLASLVILPALAAQDTTARPTGLPKGPTWTFNIAAGVGYFSYGNSLYEQTRPDGPPAGTGANWAEGYVKPSISAVLPTGKSEWYGALSVVGERTFAAPPPLVGSEASSYGLENLYIGWRSGKSIAMGENAVDLSLGMEPYKIGQGLLLWDGGAEGGVRGGYWSNARTAWLYAGIAKFHLEANTLELFALQRNPVPGFDQKNKVFGFNYQLLLGTKTTLGATYLHLANDSLAYRDGENVYNLRAYTSPFKSLPDLAINAEYAYENNGSLLTSNGWYAELAYSFDKMAWKPTLSYRYAWFEGDNPNTTKSEAFDPLFTGFYDWGTWWQGEIAGEYFLLNSNLISNEIRLKATPNESLSPNLIAYFFSLERAPSSVTSKDIGFELDAILDWKMNTNMTFSFVLATLSPGGALKQEFNRTSNLNYGMIYFAYTY
jgi:hypothetical protein